MVGHQCEIPKDEKGNPYHVHHIDGNKQNNSIYNLELLSPSEHNKKHPNQMLGKHHSEETKKIISDKKKGNNHWLGKHHSEESKRKISESLKGKTVSKDLIEKLKIANSKCVLVYNKYTNEYISEYPSIVEASKSLNVKEQNISACCRNVIKSAGGYIFKFKEEE